MHRNYERRDYSWLLAELNGKADDTEVLGNRQDEKSCSGLKSSNNDVSLARRQRASLLDNRSMLYAFSTKHRVLHDRDCPKVSGISDEHFRMSSEFVKGMRLCPECQNRIYIRHGIGDDWRRISDYERFFNRMELQEKDLYSFFIGNNAHVKWIDFNTLEAQVHHDTWRVIQNGERVELWHNNYWRLEDSGRSMERDFHLQSTCVLRCAWMLFRDMCTYSYEKHRCSALDAIVRQVGGKDALEISVE